MDYLYFGAFIFVLLIILVIGVIKDKKKPKIKEESSPTKEVADAITKAIKSRTTKKSSNKKTTKKKK